MKLPYDKTATFTNTFGLTGLLLLAGVMFAGQSYWFLVPSAFFVFASQGLQIKQDKE
tara:strand:- start:19452 stop:19622 length:171 start_codon:yes stop_codon:yes gene_type:complete